MKTAQFILKIVGAALRLAGLACLIIGFWDVIFPRHYEEY